MCHQTAVDCIGYNADTSNDSVRGTECDSDRDNVMCAAEGLQQVQRTAGFSSVQLGHVGVSSGRKRAGSNVINMICCSSQCFYR